MAYQGYPPTIDPLADNSVETSEIQNGAVTEDKLAGSAATTAKIADDAVTVDKIAAGAVDSTALGSDAVTNDKLASDSVDTAEIVNDAVTNDKILDGAIDYDKLAAALIANQAEAEAGTATNKLMTAERSKQSLDANVTKVLLETIVASNQSTVEFTSNIDSTFDRYIIEIDNLAPATDNTHLVLRTSSDTGVTWDSSSNNYKNVRMGARAGGGLDVEGSNGAMSAQLGTSETSLSSVAGEQSNFTLTIYEPANASTYTVIKFEATGINVSSNVFDLRGAVSREEINLVDAIQLSMQAGNISTGEFRLYGLR